MDGGQSSTTALIGDETGGILGTGVGGPCNHAAAAEGRTKLIRAVQDSVGAARELAGLPAGARFRSACFGMSGGPADKEAILAEILPADRLLVTDDAVIALAGAMAGGPGVIVIAGTGSIAFGRNEEGVSARAGGWGYVFGDEGSAFDIARQALRGALRMAEGWGPPTGLSQMFLEATGAADMNAVLHLFYTPDWPRSRVAPLAREVNRLAEAGDSIAAQILRDAAQHLASLTASVSRQLWKKGEPVPAAYVGGVFESRILLAHYRLLVASTGHLPGPPKLNSAAGALLEAYRAAGVLPDLDKLLSSKF